MRFIKRQTTDNLNINWGNFYRSIFALVLPMALQNVINVGVTATDVFMLGRVGEKVLSGASLAGADTVYHDAHLLWHHGGGYGSYRAVLGEA